MICATDIQDTSCVQTKQPTLGFSRVALGLTAQNPRLVVRETLLTEGQPGGVRHFRQSFTEPQGLKLSCASLPTTLHTFPTRFALRDATRSKARNISASNYIYSSGEAAGIQSSFGRTLCFTNTSILILVSHHSSDGGADASTCKPIQVGWVTPNVHRRRNRHRKLHSTPDFTAAPFQYSVPTV